MRRISIQPIVSMAFTAVVGLYVTSVALAAGGAGAGPYKGIAGDVQDKLQSAHIAGNVQSGGALPFTGLELSLVVVGAIGLALLGVMMRRASRERN
jgi:hypothetical protein